MKSVSFKNLVLFIKVMFCLSNHQYRYKTAFIVGLLAIYTSILGRTTRPNKPVYIAKRPIMTVVLSLFKW